MSIVAPQHYHDSMCLETYMSCDTLSTLLDMSDEGLERRLEAIDRVINNHERALNNGEGKYLLSAVIGDELRLNNIEVYKNLLLNLKDKPTKKPHYHPTKMNGMMTDWKKLNNVLRFNSNDMQSAIEYAFKGGIEVEGGVYIKENYTKEWIELLKDTLKMLKHEKEN